MKKINILGISAFFHDSAVALLQNGKIKYASQEERFSRIKHDSNFPINALNDLLKFNNLKLNQIDYIVFFEKPFLKFERLVETYLAFAPKGFKQFLFSMPIWLREKLFMKKEAARWLYQKVGGLDYQRFEEVAAVEAERGLGRGEHGDLSQLPVSWRM